MVNGSAQPAPYGSWPSPIGADLVAEHDGRPQFLGAIGEELWWTAPRPAEGGRRALIRLRGDGSPPQSVLPPPWNVRTKVHEYGGQPWAGATRPGAGPLVVFADCADQRLYRLEPDAAEPDAGIALPRPLTPLSAIGGGLRWADPVIAPDGDEVWCVLEEFTGDAPTDVRRVLAAVPLDGSAADDRSAIRELTTGEHRFVTGPRISPDGRYAAWITWDHPRMPWDGTELQLAAITPAGELAEAAAVAGGEEESIAQAEWSADGRLLFSSDRTGWWNLYRASPRGGAPLALTELEPLCPREEEFADALWNLGLRWFAPLADGTIAVLHGKGAKRLGLLDPDSGSLTDAAGPWQEWSPALAVQGSRVTGIAASAASACEIVQLDTATGHTRAIAEHHRDVVDPAWLPRPAERTFTGRDGREVHAQLYPPQNPEYTGPDGELAPYVLWVHGGPTGRAPMVLDLEIAYFTSRGIGVAEVNHGGSTGYGRAYRNRLREQWGVVDVADCALVAEALVDEGLADPARLAIRGGSAGGWTTAASLASPELTGDRYACGTVIYPVLDLTGWATGDTHDFESRYLDTLVGPLSEVPERYRERSPLHRAENISRPFLLLQGLEDAVCPPVQCDRFLTQLAGRDIPHAYLTFAGEGHGFRRAETIRRAVEAELSLYTQTFGLRRDDVPALPLGT